VDRERLAEFCCRHKIRRLSLFGSVLSEDFRPDSDVDVLVEYEAGSSPGWEIIDMEDELGQLFGRDRIDIVNRKYLNSRVKDWIVPSAVVLYEVDDTEG
jgi:predicted nucleotidyltransferase